MNTLEDFVVNRPYVNEARRRLAEFKAARPNPSGKLSDDTIIQLMADYAVQTRQEGYEDGYPDGRTEGYSEGYDDGYTDGSGEY